MKLLTAKKIIRKNIICFVLASLLILSMTGCQGKTNSGSTLDRILGL